MDLVFVSGATGYDCDSKGIDPDVAVQANQCLLDIQHTLKEAGSSVRNIVRITYILPDRDDFEKCWPVLRKWLGDVRPAATMYETRLLNDAMKIEIEVTAKVDRP